MMAELSGALTVNDQGCISLHGDVVLADQGSRVTPDGRSVVFPGNLVVPLGSGIVGGGGGYGGRAWLEHQVRGEWDDDLVDALRVLPRQRPPRRGRAVLGVVVRLRLSRSTGLAACRQTAARRRPSC